MPWNWSPRIDRVGKPSEVSSTEPWQSQKAETLHRLLKHNVGRFNAEDLDGDLVKRQVYLTEQAKSIEDEVEADMITGFKAWLQGTHPDNRNPQVYQNGEGKPVRRNMDGTAYDHADHPEGGWKPTHWGKSQLTHLPGVRQWLRHSAIEADKADLELQILAEYGPHDLESAWAYYKHWVRGRPVTFNPDKALDGGLDAVKPRRATHFDVPPKKDMLSSAPGPPSRPSGPPSRPFSHAALTPSRLGGAGGRARYFGSGRVGPLPLTLPLTGGNVAAASSEGPSPPSSPSVSEYEYPPPSSVSRSALAGTPATPASTPPVNTTAWEQTMLLSPEPLRPASLTMGTPRAAAASGPAGAYYSYSVYRPLDATPSVSGAPTAMVPYVPSRPAAHSSSPTEIAPPTPTLPWEVEEQMQGRHLRTNPKQTVRFGFDR